MKRRATLFILAAFVMGLSRMPASCYTVSYAGKNLSWYPTESITISIQKQGEATRVPVLVIMNGSEVTLARLEPGRSLLVDLDAKSDGTFGDIGMIVDEREGNDIPRDYEFVGPADKGTFAHSFIHEGTSFRFLYPFRDDEDGPTLYPAVTVIPGRTYLDLKSLIGSVRASKLYIVIEGDKHDGRRCDVMVGAEQWAMTRTNSTLAMANLVWDKKEQGIKLYLYELDASVISELQYLFFPKNDSLDSSPIKIYGIQYVDPLRNMVTTRIPQILCIQLMADFTSGEALKEIELFWSKDVSFPVIRYAFNRSEFLCLAPMRIFLTQDSDGDGLSDIESIAFGTSPSHTDTDGDKIDDGSEVHSERTILGLPIGYTAPNYRDTDHDLLGDKSDPVPTIWYLPWFPVVLVLSCAGIMGVRYLYERLYLLRVRIREAYAPIQDAASALRADIEMTKCKCDGIDLEIVISRFGEIESLLEEYDRRLRRFSFRELTSIMDELDEFRKGIENLRQSLLAKAQDYISRDIDLYKRNLRSLRDRGFRVPSDEQIAEMEARGDDVRSLLEDYDAKKNSFVEIIGNAMEAAESLVESISRSIDPAVQSPQLHLARTEFDAGKPQKAVEDLTRDIDALQHEYEGDISEMNQGIIRGCGLFLGQLQQMALKSTDDEFLGTLEELIEKTQSMDTELKSRKRFLDLPMVSELKQSLVSEALAFLENLQGRARELEHTLENSSPTGYQWQVDLELHQKIEGATEELRVKKEIGPAMAVTVEMIKHTQDCIDQYMMRVTVLKSYPQVETLIKGKLTEAGTVASGDLPVTHAEEFLRLFHARHSDSTRYDRSDKRLRRKRRQG